MCDRSAGLAVMFLLRLAPAITVGDEVLYTFEGDSLPQDAGWLVYDECDPGWCEESIESGHFVIQWQEFGGGAFINYTKRIAWLNHGPPAPPSLWVEYRYRSNRPLGPIYNSCDGELATYYLACAEDVSLYGDTALTYGGEAVGDLPLDEFYTVRFESLNGTHYRISVNGTVFVQWSGFSYGNSYLQMRGHGGCNDEFIMAVRNEWDFVRYGTIGHGESIVAANPPAGFVDPNVYSAFDRFTVTYDSPNHAYANDVAVEISGGDAPLVVATQRLDNGPPDALEIILDRPLPAGERTVFTFTDVDPANPNQPTIQTVPYTFQRGDVNADGRWNLRDFASLQTCFVQFGIGNACAAFNYGGTFLVEPSDFASFLDDFTTTGP